MPLGINTATNVAYNFYDTVGGKGKTSLLYALASVWGDPTSLPLGRTDTIAAKYQQYSVYHNLPILIDEITGMKAEDMANMLYDLVNGREKNRSNRSGTELQRGGSWQTITVSTSNQSVYEMLKTFREQTLATSMRVIEMRCDDPYDNYDKIDFDVPVLTAGDSYARYMVRIEELFQSTRIIRQAVEKIKALGKNAPYRLKAPMNIPAGRHFARLEDPRGESMMYLVSDGTDKPYRLKVRSPIFVNVSASKDLVQGCRIADVPVIMAMIDMCLGETDR